MAKLVYGISKVEFGTPTDLASMPVDLTQFAETVKGSFTLAETEATTVDAETEESAAPIDSIIDKEGVLEGSWRTFDYTPSELVKVKGGTVNGDKWVAPVSTPEIYLDVKITTKAGPEMNVYKAKIWARFTGVISKTGFSEIEVKFKALSPGSNLAAYDWDTVPV